MRRYIEFALTPSSTARGDGPTASLLPAASILLNWRISRRDRPVVRGLWNNSDVRVCLDGAGNRLIKERRFTVPDVLCGDMDSIDADVAAHFEAQGTRVEHMDDQDNTDLGKALEYVMESSQDSPYTTLFVLLPFGGRNDHVFGNFQNLLQATQRAHATGTKEHVVFISSANIAFALAPGCRYELHWDPCPSRRAPEHHESIGLIPLGAPVEGVCTEGLKWDLDGSTPLAFGGTGVVSTSNERVGDDVVIEIPKDAGWLVWTSTLPLVSVDEPALPLPARL